MRHWTSGPLLVLIGLLALGIYAAAVTVPHVFTAEDEVGIDELNANFAQLAEELNVAQQQIARLQERRTRFAYTEYGGGNAYLQSSPGDWMRIISVTLTTTGPGSVHVQASGYLTVYDDRGEGARFWFLVGDDSWSHPSHGRAGMNVASHEPEPGGDRFRSRIPIATHNAFRVEAGTHTFYAIGVHETGERATASYDDVLLTATFHPERE